MTTQTQPFVVGSTGMVWAQFGGNLVTSVFGRTGGVAAALNDYSDAQVLNSPTQVMGATGDLLYASAANTLAALAPGTTGQVLTVSSGLPAWETPTTPTLGFALIGLG
jgi:hypothetical protein